MEQVQRILHLTQEHSVLRVQDFIITFDVRMLCKLTLAGSVSVSGNTTAVTQVLLILQQQISKLEWEYLVEVFHLTPISSITTLTIIMER